MQSFEYFNPVKIVFGNDKLNQLNKYIEKYNNILLIIGKGSIKKNGVFDRILNILNENNKTFTILEGVKSNPELNKVKEGIDIVKKNSIDFILAAGGGSVIDTAKAISAGSHYNSDIWDFFMNKFKPSKAIDIGVILTIAATGSEMNCITVITNKEQKKKIGSAHPLLYPKFSILDPKLTLSINMEYTAYSAVDIIAHALEGYFTNSEKNIPIQKGFVKVIVDTVIKSMNILKDNLNDIDARSNMMWASTIALNGLLTAGIGKYRFENHMIGHALGAFYDIPHGATLSIVLPAWMKENVNTIEYKLIELGEYINNKKMTANDTIVFFENFFKSINVPVYLNEIDINTIEQSIIRNIIDTALLRKLDMREDYVERILKRALKND